MVRDVGGFGLALLRGCIVGAVSLVLVGCASGIAAGVVGAAVVVGFVTRSCYDHVQITVFDGTGHRTCKAKVEVGKDGDFTTLESCYYAQLTEGRYVVKASLPGHVTETEEVKITPRKGCPHSVQTMEISLKPPSAPAPASPYAPAPPAPPAAVPQPPATVVAPPAPAAAPSVAPQQPATTPVQRFPD